MNQLTLKHLKALFDVAAGAPTELSNPELDSLEQLDYITPFSAFRARSLTEKGTKAVKEMTAVSISTTRLQELGEKDSLREWLASIEFVVFADRHVSHHLWLDYADNKTAVEYGRRYDRRVKWEQDNSGTLPTVGWVGNAPVCISIHRTKIEGHWVMFVEDTSVTVNHQLIEDWLNKYCINARQEGQPQFVRSTDAQNFHNTIHEINRLNKKE